MKAMIDDALFANHMAFMAAHRGQLTLGEDWVRIEGHAPFLTTWTPLGENALIPHDHPPVRLAPGSGPGWPARLEREGYRPAEVLTYLELGGPPASQPPPAGYDVRPARSANDAAAFAQVQAAAFLTPGSAHRDWWIDCFHRMARANYRRADQEFLIAWRGGDPDAVLLAVDAAGVTGLYAVATRPEAQRKGLSTCLLQQAYQRARARGLGRIILQAALGSYADGFYRRLGFFERYRSEIWRKTAEGAEKSEP